MAKTQAYGIVSGQAIIKQAINNNSTQLNTLQKLTMAMHPVLKKRINYHAIGGLGVLQWPKPLDQTHVFDTCLHQWNVYSAEWVWWAKIICNLLNDTTSCVCESCIHCGEKKLSRFYRGALGRWLLRYKKWTIKEGFYL